MFARGGRGEPPEIGRWPTHELLTKPDAMVHCRTEPHTRDLLIVRCRLE